MRAKLYPQKIALKIKKFDKNEKKNNIWKEIDYLTYYKNVVNFSHSLNYWLGDKINVAILGFNSPGWFYSHLGCMLNGGISIGMCSTSNKEICKEIINNSDAKVLVVEDDKQLEKFIGMNLSNIKLIIYYSPISEKMIDKFTIPILSMGNFMCEKKKTQIPKIKLSDIATLIYTSGSTGKPKGVICTHKNIMTSLNRTLTLIKTKSSIKNFNEENFISYLPLNHIMAQMMDIYIPIITIGTVWFSDKDTLKKDLSLTLKQIKPSCFIGVPRIWEKIQEQIENSISKEGIKGSIVKTFFYEKILEKIGFDKCKLYMSASAPLSENTKNFFNSIGIQINDIYGMSETCGPISISLPALNKPYSVGYPIMGIKIDKQDETNDIGEILVNGDNLFKNYYKNEKETNLSFKNGWFKTGDLGKLDKEGFLYIIGRKKELIITSGGENIHPVPIEQKLSEYLSKYFEYIIVIGDKLKFLSVLLAHPKNIEKEKDINNIILNAINETNSDLSLIISNAHTIKKYLILNDKFTVNNELTPTMKIKRSFIQKKYNSKIKKLYL